MSRVPASAAARFEKGWLPEIAACLLAAPLRRLCCHTLHGKAADHACCQMFCWCTILCVACLHFATSCRCLTGCHCQRWEAAGVVVNRTGCKPGRHREWWQEKKGQEKTSRRVARRTRPGRRCQGSSTSTCFDTNTLSCKHAPTIKAECALHTCNARILFTPCHTRCEYTRMRNNHSRRRFAE